MALPRLEPDAANSLEPTPKHVRAVLDGKVVADSRRAMIVRGPSPPPRTYAFPPEDIGEVPASSRVDVEGHVALQWEDMDRWYEEDEEVFVHPRDPGKRIDALASSRHVVVEHGGVRLAESRRPVVLFEPGLLVRYYLPHADVDMARLHPSDTTTACPYKGWASYFHADVGERVRDLAWTYRAPLREVEPIRGLICFFNEKVRLTVDGEAEKTPPSPWGP